MAGGLCWLLGGEGLLVRAKPCQKLGSLFDVAGDQGLLMNPCSHVWESQPGLGQAWALPKPTTSAGPQGMEQMLSTGKRSLRNLGSPLSQVLSQHMCLSCRQRSRVYGHGLTE